MPLSTGVVYSGLLIALSGLFVIIRPNRRHRFGTRKHGGLALAIGLLLVILAWALPVREMHATGHTRLDEIVPRYQFVERHQRHIDAMPAHVWQTLLEVKASDIRFFRALTTIRRFGRPGPESILNAPEGMPILDVALRTTFVRLAEEPMRELVVGTTLRAPPGATEPRTPNEYRDVGPGFAVAAMNFYIEPDNQGGSILTTETRVFAADPASRRRFARYWSVIYPGSALIRREWLRAVERGAGSLRDNPARR
jgi:hypothetical protein